MAKDSGTIYFIAGLLMGGMVGAGVGMLLAPENGEATRKQVKSFSKKLLDNSMDAFHTFEKETLTPTLEKVNVKIKEKVDEVQKEGLDTTIKKIKTKISSSI